MKLKIHNKHMEVNCATVELFKQQFPDGLVRKEVGYKQLSPHITTKGAFQYIEKDDNCAFHQSRCSPQKKGANMLQI